VTGCERPPPGPEFVDGVPRASDRGKGALSRPESGVASSRRHVELRSRRAGACAEEQGEQYECSHVPSLTTPRTLTTPPTMAVTAVNAIEL